MQAFILAILFLLSSCNYHRDKVSTSHNAELGWFATLQAKTFTPQCLKCHTGINAAAGVDLSDYDAVMASQTVIPFKPDQSSLLLAIRSGDMPKSAEPLSSQAIVEIEEWIRAGAPEFREDSVPSPLPEPPVDPVTPPPLESTYSWLQENIFVPRCLRCHSGEEPAADLDVSSYGSLIGSGYLVSGEPEESFLYLAVLDGYMPPGKSKDLNSQELDWLRQWIVEGTLEN